MCDRQSGIIPVGFIIKTQPGIEGQAAGGAGVDEGCSATGGDGVDKQVRDAARHQPEVRRHDDDLVRAAGEVDEGVEAITRGDEAELVRTGQRRRQLAAFGADRLVLL